MFKKIEYPLDANEIQVYNVLTVKGDTRYVTCKMHKKQTKALCMFYREKKPTCT